MGKLRVGHFVEASAWLLLCLILYIYSFEFDQPIEIYKFGATAWPRTIILLIAIAAIGQFLYQWRHGDKGVSEMFSAASDDGAEEAAEKADHANLPWYLSTAGLLVIPFAYMRVPEWITGDANPAEGEGHLVRVLVAGALIAIFAFFMRKNTVGAILTLPLFFAAMLEDLGFYALAPVFILAVMFLMGERRIKPMLGVMALILVFMLTLFVKILYVGLPTGNIHPFYDIGTWVVTVLQ